MKLLEIEIYNVRGIRELSFKPNGNNMVIVGPNGSGKSSVVDALDFLLTGDIARLRGKGTAGITLKQHGPHMDHRPEDAKVQGLFQMPGIDEPVELIRCLDAPKELQITGASSQDLDPVFELAKRGQHFLSRREILKYITAEAGTRAQEIQALLDITELENIRKTLVKVANKAENNKKQKKRNQGAARGDVSATLGEQKFNAETVLEVVNQNREILGGDSITTLQSNKLKSELTPPTAQEADDEPNIDLLKKTITTLHKTISDDSQEDIRRWDSELRELIRTIRDDPNLLYLHRTHTITRLGLQIIEETETENCPLCDTSWTGRNLEQYLRNKLNEVQQVSEMLERIEETSQNIADYANAASASLTKVQTAAETLHMEDETELLKAWKEELDGFLDMLDDPLEKYSLEIDTAAVTKMLSPTNTKTILDRLSEEAQEQFPQASPEQNAWDTLTRLEVNLERLESADQQLEQADLVNDRAQNLLRAFLKARDDILGKLYNNIQTRFVDLYRGMHGTEAEEFEATLEHKGAGLNLEVGFYGRGKHPPHALHSEGHQDSMGLCLYLALAEELTEGIIDLIVLDDVVMSIDADHRRSLCSLLSEKYNHRQLLITTHDTAWANQLRVEGIVNRAGIIEFHNWDVQYGPLVTQESIIWQLIENDLDRNDIPSAALRLRRGLEQFAAVACDRFNASVTYKLSGRFDLGDLLPAAVAAYLKTIRKAKAAAHSWGNTADFEFLNELDKRVGQIHQNTNMEQWAINVNVHYNEWVNFSANDFRPVVNAFKELHDAFFCGDCDAMYQVLADGRAPAALRCNCTAFSLTRDK